MKEVTCHPQMMEVHFRLQSHRRRNRAKMAKCRQQTPPEPPSLLKKVRMEDVDCALSATTLSPDRR